ncbi:hypothetical protein OUZ56_005091 [Daphnia magna]|uniref:Uncharacterized protein n=1 Tax=Daphnia magna TaxID=35525 RepID=A0ABQ9YRU7_9CRUS|nr:hypothetical protein OUZ56_005091 [Daphnia magna]
MVDRFAAAHQLERRHRTQDERKRRRRRSHELLTTRDDTTMMMMMTTSMRPTADKVTSRAAAYVAIFLVYVSLSTLHSANAWRNDRHHACGAFSFETLRLAPSCPCWPITSRRLKETSRKDNQQQQQQQHQK